MLLPVIKQREQKRSVSFLPVYFFGIEHFCPHYIALKRTVEAGGITRVARSAGLLDFIDQAVLIAVGKDAHNLLEMAALLAFLPELLPAPAVVVGKQIGRASCRERV